MRFSLLPLLLVGALATATPAGPSRAGNIVTMGGGFDFNVGVTSIREARFRNVVRQHYDFSCGSASIATLLTYHYGLPTTERDVFDAMFDAGDQELIQTRGFSMLDMKTYLEAHGFTADGYQTELDTLTDAGSPAIVLINLNGYMHFVVVKGVTDTEVLVGDPALGMRVYPRETFEAMWNGILFVITSHMEDGREAFNVAQDWQVRHRAPLGTALGRDSLSNLTMMLPLPGEF